MIVSMTGFGRAKDNFGDIEISLEIKSVNSRFLETSIRLPRQFSAFEISVKETIQKHINRGKINVNIYLNEGKATVAQLVLDHSLLKQYLVLANEIREEANIKKEIELSDLLGIKDLIGASPDEEKENTYREKLISVLISAIKVFNQTRESEGRAMKKDIVSRLELMRKTSAEIEKYTDSSVEMIRTRLQNRLSELTDLDKLENDRIETEIVMLAEKSDIVEEIVRLNAHIEEFAQAMERDSAPGKRLNFLTQEMHREANTMGSKAATTEISHLSVSLREEIERIREQVQNIE